MKDKKELAANLLIGILVLAIIVVVGLTVVIWQKSNVLSQEVSTQQTADTTPENNTGMVEKWQEGDVSYNGKTYRYNASIKTYLFMGIDKDGVVTTAEDGISGGQSDVLFLFVQNDKTKELAIIAIHRNTMTRLDIYDEAGNYVGQTNGQICLQHAYGDGKRQSCQRSVDAISYLFYNLPIHGYFALNMGGIPVLNEAVGGVEVKVLHDLKSDARNVSLTAGETVLLNGDEAYVYLRSRNVDEFDSATRRLERQQQYLTALASKVEAIASQGESGLLKIYDAVEDYSVSNIDFADLAEDAAEYGQDGIKMYSLPGETIMGEKFEEYHLDKDAFYEMVIEVFYEEVTE